MLGAEKKIKLENLSVHSGYKMWVFDPKSGEFQRGTFNYVPKGLSFVHLRGTRIVPVVEGSIVQTVPYSGGTPKRSRLTFTVAVGAKRDRKPGPGRGTNTPRGRSTISLNGLEKHFGEVLALADARGEVILSGELRAEDGRIYLAYTKGLEQMREYLEPGKFVIITHPKKVSLYEITPARLELDWSYPPLGERVNESHTCSQL